MRRAIKGRPSMASAAALAAQIGADSGSFSHSEVGISGSTRPILCCIKERGATESVRARNETQKGGHQAGLMTSCCRNPENLRAYLQNLSCTIWLIHTVKIGPHWLTLIELTGQPILKPLRTGRCISFFSQPCCDWGIKRE